jgi:hypothetical protein
VKLFEKIESNPAKYKPDSAKRKSHECEQPWNNDSGYCLIRREYVTKINRFLEDSRGIDETVPVDDSRRMPRKAKDNHFLLRNSMEIDSPSLGSSDGDDDHEHRSNSGSPRPDNDDMEDDDDMDLDRGDNHNGPFHRHSRELSMLFILSYIFLFSPDRGERESAPNNNDDCSVSVTPRTTRSKRPRHCNSGLSSSSDDNNDDDCTEFVTPRTTRTKRPRRSNSFSPSPSLSDDDVGGDQLPSSGPPDNGVAHDHLPSSEPPDVGHDQLPSSGPPDVGHDQLPSSGPSDDDECRNVFVTPHTTQTQRPHHSNSGGSSSMLLPDQSLHHMSVAQDSAVINSPSHTRATATPTSSTLPEQVILIDSLPNTSHCCLSGLLCVC